jgi:hypothetical protein
MKDIDWKEVRLKTKMRLTEMEVPMHPYLPLRDESRMRGTHDVAFQIVVLNALDGLANDTKPSYLKAWLKRYDIWETMDTKDQAYFGRDLSQDLCNELTWKVESLRVLAWVATITDILPPPLTGERLMLEAVYDSIPPQVNLKNFNKSLVLRSLRDVKEEVDFYYCLHAAMRHPDMWVSQKRMAAFCYGDILERRRALEWLISPTTRWHDITLDT